MYKSIAIKSITKFFVFDIGNVSTSQSQFKLSSSFWRKLFSRDYFQNFVENKYIPFKRIRETEESFQFFLEEYKFLLSKIDIVKFGIDVTSKVDAPSGRDAVFAFRVFSMILSYYNEYYDESGISIDLRLGLVFHKPLEGLQDFTLLTQTLYNSSNLFFVDIVYPLIDDYISSGEEEVIYKFEIFWPTELFAISNISTYIKQKNSLAKFVLDFSDANEQFDFTQWVNLLKNSEKIFFKYFDFFIVNRDFGTGMKGILRYVNNYSPDFILENVVYIDNNGEVVFNDITNSSLTPDILENFTAETFQEKNIMVHMGKKAIFGRFLPYKCYWNNCSFCAINSNNKVVYNKEYGYEFFIEKWVNFIEKNQISAVSFRDEAVPPIVIIQFAKKIIQKGLKINYQFRSRFDILYTKENCKILGLSGARYAGFGLESAVERVNRELGNKGDYNLTLEQKIKIIYYFELAGVSFHNYSIMGFPGETDKEILTTFSFLKSNILKSKYYTCTPNIFGLMKGTKILQKKEDFGIYVDQKQIENPFMLSYDFTVNGAARNMDLLRSCSDELHRVQFLPWVELGHPFLSPRSFWDFIDRSYLFYLMKRFHKENPYHTYWKVNDPLLNRSLIDIKKHYFDISNSFQIYENADKERIYVCDWVNGTTIGLPSEFRFFLERYDNTICLEANLLNNSISDTGFIYELLRNRILLLR